MPPSTPPESALLVTRQAALKASIGAAAVPAPLPLASPLRLYQAPDVLAAWQHASAPPALLGAGCPYWAIAWPGGQALARLLLDRPQWVNGRCVVDLGTGGGVCAIAAAVAGAARVVALDSDPSALAMAGLNAELNGVALELQLGDPIDEPIDDALPPETRVLLAADLWYEPFLARRVTRWLRHLAAGGIDVLIADPGRAHFPRRALEPLASFDVPTSEHTERARTTPVQVCRMLANDAA